MGLVSIIRLAVGGEEKITFVPLSTAIFPRVTEDTEFSLRFPFIRL
jgi:hypothetical protein